MSKQLKTFLLNFKYLIKMEKKNNTGTGNFLTSNPDILEEVKEYEIIFKNRKYKVNFLFLSDFFLFIIYPLKKVKKFYFLYKSKFENLKNNSQILGLYVNNSDIICLVNELFVNNKIYLDSNEKNKKELNLIIKLQVLNKEEILILPLEKKNLINKNNNKGYIIIENELKKYQLKNSKNKCNSILNHINLIENKFNCEFDNFNKEINEIKNNNKYLNEQINSITHQISNLNQILELNIDSNNINDNIIKENKYNIKKILKRIEQFDNEEKNNNLNISTTTTTSNTNSNKGLNVLKKIIKKKEEKNIEKLRNCFLNKSKIILKEDEIDFIINKLDKYNPIAYKLIYSSSLDGDSAKSFHSKCDGENFILLIIETTKGYKFGGFTSIGFDSSGFELYDDNAFLFSIDKNKIYEIISANAAAIYCNKRYGPIFCSKNDFNKYNICICDNFLNNVSTTSKKSFNYKISDEYELNFGEKNFIVKELEIYKLILINY